MTKPVQSSNISYKDYGSDTDDEMEKVIHRFDKDMEKYRSRFEKGAEESKRIQEEMKKIWFPTKK